MHGYLYFHKLFPDRSLCLLLLEHVFFDSGRQTQKYMEKKERVNLTYTKEAFAIFLFLVIIKQQKKNLGRNRNSSV
jgi:hypothetical protein